MMAVATAFFALVEARGGCRETAREEPRPPALGHEGVHGPDQPQTRDENARMLALHDALLLPVVRGYRGAR